MMTGPAGVWKATEQIVTTKGTYRDGPQVLFLPIHQWSREHTLLPLRLGCLVELMARDSPAILSHRRNEWLHREIRNCRGGPPPPLPDFITCSLILFVFPQTWHKTRSSIVYIPQRTFGAFLDGLDPVCAACLPSLCLSHSEALQQGDQHSNQGLWPCMAQHCVYK